MKTLNDYLAMSYRMEIVEDKDGGGFVVSFPELPGFKPSFFSVLCICNSRFNRITAGYAAGKLGK